MPTARCLTFLFQLQLHTIPTLLYHDGPGVLLRAGVTMAIQERSVRKPDSILLSSRHAVADINTSINTLTRLHHQTNAADAHDDDNTEHKIEYTELATNSAILILIPIA